MLIHVSVPTAQSALLTKATMPIFEEHWVGSICKNVPATINSASTGSVLVRFNSSLTLFTYKKFGLLGSMVHRVSASWIFPSLNPPARHPKCWKTVVYTSSCLHYHADPLWVQLVTPAPALPPPLPACLPSTHVLAWLAQVGRRVAPLERGYCHACSCSSSPWLSRAPGSPGLCNQATISMHTCLSPSRASALIGLSWTLITCVIAFPISVCSLALFPASGLMFVTCPCFPVCWCCSCHVLCPFLIKCLTPCTSFFCSASLLIQLHTLAEFYLWVSVILLGAGVLMPSWHAS